MPPPHLSWPLNKPSSSSCSGHLVGLLILGVGSVPDLSSIRRCNQRKFVGLGISVVYERVMPRYKDEPPAVRVYTVCDESKYLIVRNVPSLGCGDQLLKLFSSYGEVEECKPMDAEDSDPFTDVYWIKFYQVNNARFAKRKLDEGVFIGNRLQVSYAPQFENLADTKQKLERRRKEVLERNSSGRAKPSKVYRLDDNNEGSAAPLPTVSCAPLQFQSCQRVKNQCQEKGLIVHSSPLPDKEYFPTPSMNQTVQLVRDKLNKIQSSEQHAEAGSSKKPRINNRRRI